MGGVRWLLRSEWLCFCAVHEVRVAVLLRWDRRWENVGEGLQEVAVTAEVGRRSRVRAFRLASGVVRMGPDRRYDSFGLCFGPNRRFSTHFGPHLMFLAPKPDPLSETSTFVLSQQQTSVLSQQQTSVLYQQQTSALSQQKTSILSQQKTGQLPAAVLPSVVTAYMASVET